MRPKNLCALAIVVWMPLAAAPALAYAGADSAVSNSGWVDAVDGASAQLDRRASRPPPRKKRPARPAPDPRRRRAPRQANPGLAGLAAAGGAAGGALVGGGTVALAGLVLTGAFAPPTLPIVVTASIVAVGAGLATPFLAGLGGGGALLLADPRSTAADWSGLVQCAGTGVCAGLGVLTGPLCGLACGALPCIGGMCGPCGGCGLAPDLGDIPGPDEPAKWTAGGAIAGLVGGGVLGALIGWSVASSPDDPLVPIAAGALIGGVVGSGAAAGTGAAIATSLRRGAQATGPAARPGGASGRRGG